MHDPLFRPFLEVSLSASDHARIVNTLSFMEYHGARKIETANPRLSGLGADITASDLSEYTSKRRAKTRLCTWLRIK